MKKATMLLPILFLAITLAQSQQVAKTFNNPISYLLYLPKDYEADTTKRWPMMIFLHGSGQRGTDIEKVKMHGLPKLVEQGKQFPAIVISPQASNFGWEPFQLRNLILDLRSRYRVDHDRVYLTGLSMGGYGTWTTAMNFPWLFAAIAPICGGGDTTDIWKLSHMPVWCFHGEKDEAVSVEESKKMMGALKHYNKNIRLTLYPEVGHNSWDSAYGNDSLFQWMFAQKRNNFAKITLDVKKLKEYEGTYNIEGKHSVNLVAVGDKLQIKEHPQMELVALGNDQFITRDGEKAIELIFQRNKSGKVGAIQIFGDKRIIAPKTN